MKKTVSILTAVLLLVTLLSACKSNVPQTDESETSMNVAASVKTGLGTVYSTAVSADALTAKTVAAAVKVGDGGKITACRVDELETDAKLENGKITREADRRSKYTMGYDYGLSSVKPLEKEWFEQIDALCDYVVGKTAAEVAEIPLDNGVPTDEALRSRCELTVSPYLDAIGKACDMAADRGAQAGDMLSLSLTASDDEGGDAFVREDVQIALVTLNARGVVTDCVVDVTGRRIDVKDGAFVGETGDYPSKKDQKTGLDDTSDTETDAEWTSSARAFEEYVTGKTAAQVKATPLTKGRPAADTDLAKKCTIPVATMLQNVLNAIDSATATGSKTHTATQTAADSVLDKASKAADDVVSMAEDAVSRVGDALTELR